MALPVPATLRRLSPKWSIPQNLPRHESNPRCGVVLMGKWLVAVIGWGIVGPVLAIAASYVLSGGPGKQSWRPGCRLSGLRHRPVSLPVSRTLYGYSFVRTPQPDGHDGRPALWPRVRGLWT